MLVYNSLGVKTSILFLAIILRIITSNILFITKVIPLIILYILLSILLNILVIKAIATISNVPT